MIGNIRNMTGRTGREVANQIIITEEGRGSLGNFITIETFQSHNTVIAVKTVWKDDTTIELDINSWDYSALPANIETSF